MILKPGDLPDMQNARRFGGRRISEREQYAVLAVLLFAMLDRRPPVAMFCFLRFYRLLYIKQRPPVAPSFVARRKIGEKGVPRRRKLHILRFAFRGKSSVVPLLLLSPPNPLTLGFGGAPIGGPRWIPGVMVWAILTCFVRTISQWCV